MAKRNAKATKASKSTKVIVEGTPEPTEVPAVVDAIPTEAGAFLAFVTATVLPGLRTQYIREYGKQNEDKSRDRSAAFVGKGVSMLALQAWNNDTSNAGRKVLPAFGTRGTMSSVKAGRMAQVLHARFADVVLPSGCRVSQVTMAERIACPTPADARAIAGMLAEAREAGLPDDIRDGAARTVIARILADADAFDRACAEGASSYFA